MLCDMEVFCDVESWLKLLHCCFYSLAVLVLFSLRVIDLPSMQEAEVSYLGSCNAAQPAASSQHAGASQPSVSTPACVSGDLSSEPPLPMIGAADFTNCE